MYLESTTTGFEARLVAGWCVLWGLFRAGAGRVGRGARRGFLFCFLDCSFNCLLAVWCFDVGVLESAADVSVKLTDR